MSIDLTAEDSQQDDKCDLDFTHLGTQRSGYGNVQSSAHPPRELEVMIKATKKELEEVRCEVQSLKDKVEYFNNQLLWGRWSQSPGIPSDESSGFCLDRNEACNSLSHHCEEVVFHPDIILCRPIRSGREVNPYSVDSSPTQGKFIYFGKLPASIQAAIFRLWLHINGRTIHCFSRLGHLDHAHERPRKTSHARHRHYWGHAKRVHFEEDTEDPQDLLRILLVSKYFYLKGAEHTMA
ncbi:hypothetical protein VTK73DRAFT_5373 [Phialemonium thermophilum]|uniref:Uncharacterized protein n=1 Tax=Phialemonium thermophilum TaxID=223376 RepID=A0ABR3XX30_9PEZI